MSYSACPTVATGDLWSAANHNTYIRDNFAAGVPDIFTTKGDLAAATGPDAATRLGVGTNGQFLKADSPSAPGVKWEYPIVLNPAGYWTNTAWDGDVKSPGTYTIDTSAWGLPAGVKAVFVEMEAKWAAQNTATDLTITRTGDTAGLVVCRALWANGSDNRGGLIPCDSNGDFDVIVHNASTTYTYLKIMGYIPG